MNVWAFGDSVTEGQSQLTDTTAYKKRWTEIVVAHLRDRYPTVGEIVRPDIPNFVPIDCYSTFPSLWSTAGSSSPLTTKGASANARSFSNGATATLHIPVGVSEVRISTFGGSSFAAWALSIDGAADSASTYLPSQTSGSTRAFLSEAVTLNPGVPHKIVLTAGNGTNWLSGAFCFSGNESKGVRLFNAGHSGSRVKQYITANDGTNYGWIDTSNPTQASNGMSCWDAYPPDLVLMGHMLNDYSSAAGDGSAANFKTDIQTVIAAIKARYSTRQISFVLLSTYERFASPKADPWSAFVAAKKEIAETDDDACHFDWGQRMPKAIYNASPAQELGIYADSAHPTIPKGYVLMGDTLTGFLLPR